MNRNLEELRKTLSESDITDKLIIPNINKVIQSLILVHNPLRNNLPRKPGSGDASYTNTRSAAPAAETVADTTDFTAKESTYATRSKLAFKTVGIKGKVTRKAQAVGRSYADLKTEEINACLDSVKDKEEDLIINGDATADSTQFDGLVNLVTSGQTLTAGSNGAPLTLSLLDEAIDQCYGLPDMIVCSKRTRRELNALLQSQQRFVDRIEVRGGFKVLSYNDIPIYWSQHQSDTETQGTATDASSIYVLDTTKVWMEVLTELQLSPLANTSSQYDQFDVYMDEVLVLANEKYCSRIKGVVPPA